MTRKIMGSSISWSEPYARIITRPRIGYKGAGGLGVQVELQLSSGAVREYDLHRGEKVNIFWDIYNKVWQCPILVLKRGGSHRVLYSNNSRNIRSGYLKLSIASAVHQLHIPLLTHRLPILDYVDNEIWIDFTARDDNRKKKKKEKEIKTERFSVCFGRYEETTARWGVMYKSAIEQVAKVEGLSTNALILRATSRYMEDEHPEIWHQLDKIVRDEAR